MTWREILEGLAQLPGELRQLRRGAKVSIVSLKESDVIMVESDSALSQGSRERLSEMVNKIWPDNRVVVWDSGLRMRVVAGDKYWDGGH